jgi:hypothetical protein
MHLASFESGDSASGATSQRISWFRMEKELTSLASTARQHQRLPSHPTRIV